MKNSSTVGTTNVSGRCVAADLSVKKTSFAPNFESVLQSLQDCIEVDPLLTSLDRHFRTVRSNAMMQIRRKMLQHVIKLALSELGCAVGGQSAPRLVPQGLATLLPLDIKCANMMSSNLRTSKPAFVSDHHFQVQSGSSRWIMETSHHRFSFLFVKPKNNEWLCPPSIQFPGYWLSDL